MSHPCSSKLLTLMILVPLASSFYIQSLSSQIQKQRQHRRRRPTDGGPGRFTAARGVLLRLYDPRTRQQVENVRIRGATADEAGAARQVLLGHAMNPLFVSERNLLVATRRIRPTPSATTASRDGDGDSYGKVDKEDEEEEERVIGFGQIRPLPQDEKDGGGGDPMSSSSSDNPSSASFWELASLFVDPEHRRMGVGTAIIQELLRRHDEHEQQQEKDGGNVLAAVVLLLTLAPTAPLYEPHGFRIVDAASSEFRNLPQSVRLEHAAGKALSWILGNELVCMVRRRR
jgi:GNAT superfamily N-acetyltransferase